jgi:hypothetical protein
MPMPAIPLSAVRVADKHTNEVLKHLDLLLLQEISTVLAEEKVRLYKVQRQESLSTVPQESEGSC